MYYNYIKFLVIMLLLRQYGPFYHYVINIHY